MFNIPTVNIKATGGPFFFFSDVRFFRTQSSNSYGTTFPSYSVELHM